MNNASNVLDIGSGTGHHVDAFKYNKIKVQGIDISPHMVKQAKKNYPSNKYILGDAMNGMIFQHHYFTHITCLYFTIYYIKDKRGFFKNCYNWLLPDGFLILHLVDRDKFDPIIPAGDPLEIINPQKYAKKRITTSKVKFEGYDYSAEYKPDNVNDKAVMNEVIKNTSNGDVRKNEHQLFIPTQKKVLSIARDIGFTLVGNIDMKTCQYDTQYIYILQKK